MVCKFLHLVCSLVTPPDDAPYALSMYVQAQDCEHATQCMMDYAERHSLKIEILKVQCLYNFLIADDYQFINSRFHENTPRSFDEALDLP